jgi:hypothetical protein
LIEAQVMTIGVNAMTSSNDWVEEHMQRFCEPDGYCLHCRRPANQHHPVGPITITISAPDSDDLAHEFCNWRCFAEWTALQAGGTFIAGRS